MINRKERIKANKKLLKNFESDEKKLITKIMTYLRNYTFSKEELLEIETQVIQKAVLAHDNYAVLSDQLKDPKAYCDRFIQRYDAHKRGFWKIIIEENIIVLILTLGFILALQSIFSKGQIVSFEDFKILVPYGLLVLFLLQALSSITKVLYNHKYIFDKSYKNNLVNIINVLIVGSVAFIGSFSIMSEIAFVMDATLFMIILLTSISWYILLKLNKHKYNIK